MIISNKTCVGVLKWRQCICSMSCKLGLNLLKLLCSGDLCVWNVTDIKFTDIDIQWLHHFCLDHCDSPSSPNWPNRYPVLIGHSNFHKCSERSIDYLLLLSAQVIVSKTHQVPEDSELFKAAAFRCLSTHSQLMSIHSLSINLWQDRSRLYVCELLSCIYASHDIRNTMVWTIFKYSFNSLYIFDTRIPGNVF